MGIENWEAVVGDAGLVSRIVGRLNSTKDRHSAALVCHVWNDAVAWASRRLSVRCPSSLLQLAARFHHVFVLDLTFCFHLLDDSDLALVAASFKNLRSFMIGSPMRPQASITNRGLESIVMGCAFLENVSLAYLPNLQDEGIQAVSSYCKSLRSFALENCFSLTDNALETLSACGGLQSISLRGRFNKFTATGLASIGACGGLLRASLDLDFMEIDPALKAMAAGCSKLEEIELKFRNARLTDLTGCSTLRSLSVYSDQRSLLDEAMLGIVEANKHLVEVTFMNPFSPLSESAVISIVMRCPQLQKLHIDALSLSELALMGIANCKNLEHLSLDHYRSSGEGLAQLGMYGLQLRHFSLKSARGVRDMEIQMLMDGKTRLEHLDLQCCTGLSSIAFSAIGSCSTLQHLDLSFTDVDDLSLSEISMGVKNLKTLNLVKCEGISSSWSIAGFTTLESLNVDQCPFITDEGLNLLADSCPSLRSLSVGFTRITDAGLMWLTKCTELRFLSLPYCRAVQGEGVIAIVNSCKWLQLVVLSHRFRNSEVLQVLKDNCCFVRLEVDDMALVPFGVREAGFW